MLTLMLIVLLMLISVTDRRRYQRRARRSRGHGSIPKFSLSLSTMMPMIHMTVIMIVSEMGRKVRDHSRDGLGCFCHDDTHGTHLFGSKCISYKDGSVMIMELKLVRV